MAKKPSRTLLALSFAAATGLSSLPAAAAPAPVLGPTGGPGTYSEQNITPTMFGDSASYRIPALADLGDGIVLASWDGRPYNAADAPNPNSILMKRSTDGGKTWSDISYIAKGNLGTDGTQKYGYSDPSFVVDRETGKVFAFFVYSKNQGFWGSTYGNDISDPNVMGAVVVESADKGLTWSEPRDITPVVKPGSDKNNVQVGDVKGTFATSGEGIQLRYGQYKGRLIQQFAGMVKQADGSEKTQAYSVYSDDHGVTWKRGNFAGLEMDENKVVELSDGRVMLNSRDFSSSGFRKVAISTDGGVTYGPVTLEKQQPDPTNNASIFRMHPDAAEGSAEAKKLIFTNSNNNANRDRVNLSTRISCDDGVTWPGVRTFKQGFGAYSTGTALSTGGFGVFYEANYTNDMRFATFDEAWLNYVCAPLSVQDTTFDEGQTKDLAVTITNQEATPISGKVTVHDSNGYSAGEVTITDLAPGAQQVVTVPVTASAQARNSKLDAVFTASDGKQSRYTFAATINRVTPIVFGLTLSEGAAAERDVVANPYRVGETVPYTFRVTNTSGEVVDAIPVGGNLDVGFLPPTAPNCRYRGLADGATYQCKSAKHTVTQEDLDRGYFIPEITFEAVSKATPSKTAQTTYRGERVQLREYNYTPGAEITGSVTSEAQETYAVGDVISYSFKVRNTSEGAVDSVPLSGNFDRGFMPPQVPNCRYRNLAALSEYTCTTARHTITAEDLERGYFEPQATFTITSRQTQQSVEVAFVGDRIELPTAAEPTPEPTPTPTPEPTPTPTPEPTPTPTPEPTPTPTPVKPFFTDVAPDYPFFREIQWVAENGISTGWPDGTFRPTENISRAAVAAFIFRAAAPETYDAPAISPFRDVPVTHPFYREIAWLAESGISTGWSDGTFRPEEDISRAAVAAFFYRLSGTQDYVAPKVSPFKDLETGHQFYAEISWLSEVGITTGWPDGTFRPASAIKRDAMAAFMYRFSQ